MMISRTSFFAWMVSVIFVLMIVLPCPAFADISARFSTGIVVGPDTRACTMGLNGALRYRTLSGGTLEVCDGASTSWKSTSVSGTLTPIDDPKYVFVTKLRVMGNLILEAGNLGYTGSNGIDAGDYICQTEATDAGLPGTYKAWIAASAATSPNGRFYKSTGRYIKADATSTLVANNWTDLTDGTLASAINRHADGTSVTGELKVWTNVTDAGLLTPIANFWAQHCLSWTTSNSSNWSGLGTSNSTTATWTYGTASGQYDRCDGTHFGGPYRLYCFQQ